MNESNFTEPIDRTNLIEQKKIRLNKITEIENYFIKKLINFSSNNRNSQNITNHNKKKKRKSMIKLLCWLKVNSIALKH